MDKEAKDRNEVKLLIEIGKCEVEELFSYIELLNMFEN